MLILILEFRMFLEEIFYKWRCEIESFLYEKCANFFAKVMLSGGVE